MNVEELLIPNNVVGMVIGRRGKFINALRQQYNCSVEIRQVSETTHLCTVQGNFNNTRWVCQKIRDIIKQHHFVPEIMNQRHKNAFNRSLLTLKLHTNPVTLPLGNLTLNDNCTDVNPSSAKIIPKSEASLLLSQFKCVICYEIFNITDGCVTCSKSFEAPLLLEDSFHSICIDCIRGYAHSAITDIPVAHGGLGLKCVLHECKNVFLLSLFEIYLSDEDYLPLKLRLQEQCIADASLKDLVKCTDCGLKGCAPTQQAYFICACGRFQCRFCPRRFDAKHEIKTCQEMDDEESGEVNARQLETKISETVIRKCHKCGVAFVKLDGCNKMTCQCGAKQCYVCRQQDVDYNHFCRCGDVQQQHGPCNRCQRTCRQWENAEELDQIKINELQIQLS